MTQRFTHVALTVGADLFDPTRRQELLAFYDAVLGWSEDPRFAIPGERLLVRAPTNDQYLTLRRSADAMTTSGYEHLGIEIDSLPELHALHDRAARAGRCHPDLELGPVRTLYEGRLVTFRLRFRLPLTLEFQHFVRG